MVNDVLFMSLHLSDNLQVTLQNNVHKTYINLGHLDLTQFKNGSIINITCKFLLLSDKMQVFNRQKMTILYATIM